MKIYKKKNPQNLDLIEHKRSKAFTSTTIITYISSALLECELPLLYMRYPWITVVELFEYDFLPVVEIVQSDESMYSLKVFLYPRVQTHIQKLYNP
jgi:hypothetical protein